MGPGTFADLRDRDTGSFGSLQATPSFLRQFGTQSGGKYVLATERKSIMNSGRWIDFALLRRPKIIF